MCPVRLAPQKFAPQPCYPVREINKCETDVASMVAYNIYNELHQNPSRYFRLEHAETKSKNIRSKQPQNT